MNLSADLNSNVELIDLCEARASEGPSPIEIHPCVGNVVVEFFRLTNTPYVLKINPAFDVHLTFRDMADIQPEDRDTALEWCAKNKAYPHMEFLFSIYQPDVERLHQLLNQYKAARIIWLVSKSHFLTSEYKEEFINTVLNKREIYQWLCTEKEFESDPATRSLDYGLEFPKDMEYMTLLRSSVNHMTRESYQYLVDNDAYLARCSDPRLLEFWSKVPIDNPDMIAYIEWRLHQRPPTNINEFRIVMRAGMDIKYLIKLLVLMKTGELNIKQYANSGMEVINRLMPYVK